MKQGAIKAAVWDAMPAAYDSASAGGTLPAPARMVMYAVRRISGLGDTLKSDYFLKKLLDMYLTEHPQPDWDIVRDDRGTFREPHTDRDVPLGTLQVRQYLERVQGANHVDRDDQPPTLPLGWWTCGPVDRFGAILYIEKEGFGPLLASTRLAERWDLAIASCKGYSVQAARRLIKALHDGYKVPVFVVHDFDKQGIGIFDTFDHDSYVDLGLRLDDITAVDDDGNDRWGLSADTASESVTYVAKDKPYDPRPNLTERAASTAEIDFLCRTDRPPFHGRRVELNALQGRFVDWLEAKLEEHHVAKIVPDEATLERVYRWAYARRWLNLEIARLYEQAQDEADDADLPDDLVTQVTDGRGHPAPRLGQHRRPPRAPGASRRGRVTGLYHRTPHGEAILRDGFRDATGTYMTTNLYTGVWFSNGDPRRERGRPW